MVFSWLMVKSKLDEVLAPRDGTTGIEKEQEQQEEERQFFSHFQQGELEIERSTEEEDVGEQKNDGKKRAASSSFSSHSTFTSPMRSSQQRPPLATPASSTGTPNRTIPAVVGTMSSTISTSTSEISCSTSGSRNAKAASTLFLTTADITKPLHIKSKHPHVPPPSSKSTNSKYNNFDNKTNGQKTISTQTVNNTNKMGIVTSKSSCSVGTATNDSQQPPSQRESASSYVVRFTNVGEDGVECSNVTVVKEKEINGVISSDGHIPYHTSSMEQKTPDLIPEEQQNGRMAKDAPAAVGDTAKMATPQSRPSPPSVIHASSMSNTTPSPSTSGSSPSYSSPGATTATTTTSGAEIIEECDDREDDDNEIQLLEKRILEINYKVAQSLYGSTSQGDTHAKFFSYFGNRSTVSDKGKKKMKSMLLKQPDLLTIRFAGPRQASPDGYSPMHVAAMSGNLDAAKILLETSRECVAQYPDERDRYAISCDDVNLIGQTALHLATELQKQDLIDFLKDWWMEERGVEPIGSNAPLDINRRTPTASAHFLRNNYPTAVAKDNIDLVEEKMFSPGDRTICPTTPGTGNRRRSNRGRNKTPHKGSLSTAKKTKNGQRYTPLLKGAGSMYDKDVMYVVVEFQGRRDNMEDAWSTVFFERNMLFFGVYDGHCDNGNISRFVADHLPAKLLDTHDWKTVLSLSDNDETTNTSMALKNACENAFREACLEVDKSLRNGTESDDRDYFGGGVRNLEGGSTGVSVLVTHSHIIVANVGDSRAILVQMKNENNNYGDNVEKEQHEEGQGVNGNANATRPKAFHVVELSQDHKPKDPTERERIEKAGYEVNEFSQIQSTKKSNTTKLAVSRAFGDFDFKSNTTLKEDEQAVVAVPDIVLHARDPKDSLLVVACDGIFDVMSNDEVADFLVCKLQSILGSSSSSKNKKMSTDVLDELTHALLNECFKRKSSDNLTAIVCSLRGGGMWYSNNDTGDEVLATTKLDSKFAQEV